MNLRLPLAALLPLALLPQARADSLTLAVSSTLDISALNLGGIGDLSFATGTSKLWVCDGATNGDVYQLNPTTGAVISQFDPGAIPGLDGGPDALATPRGVGAPNVYVFSPFLESEGGRLTTAGALVFDFGTARDATGADFDVANQLWVASGTASNGGAVLLRLDSSNGTILQTTAIAGTTQRVCDLAFDPHTGACYCLLENYQLVEVDVATGAQLSSTNLSSFVPGANGIAVGIAFSPLGEKLYLAASNGTTAGQLLVLDRTFSSLACDGSGAFAPCPCGNSGAAGRGCDNSFATGGARLRLTGIPGVTHDSARLFASGLPLSGPPCLFFQGAASAAPSPIDDGLICLGGTLVRLATRPATSGGLVEYPNGGGDPLLHVRAQIPPEGGTRYYQLWYRNAASFCTPGTSNFSNAIEVFWSP